MDVRNLRTFVALAETGNLTRTAERLDYAPSSVSAHVQALEEELGVELVQRAGRGLALTESGRAFLAHAQRIVAAERAAIADVRAVFPPASLTVGAATSIVAYGLPGVLERFRAQHPGVSVAVRQGPGSEHRAAVARGELDLSIDFVDERVRERDGAAAVELLGDVEIVCVVRPGHRLAQRGALGLRALAGETLIVTDPTCSYGEAFIAALDAAKVQPGPLIELDNFEAIRRLTFDGLGAAVIPRYVVDDALRAGTLVALPIPEPDRAFGIAAAWRPDLLRPALAALLDASRTEIPVRLGLRVAAR